MSIGFNQLNGVNVSDASGNTTLGTLSSQGAEFQRGLNNTAVGYGALRTNAPSSQHNTAVGLNALSNNTGSNNLAIGENALYNFLNPSPPQSGNSNVAIGNNALNKYTTITPSGNNNVGIGHEVNANGYSSCILLGNGAVTNENATIGLGGLNVIGATGASSTVSFLKTTLNGGNTGGVYYLPLCSTNALGGGNPTINTENSNNTYYPVFAGGTGAQQLLVDNGSTNPISLNPSNGNFNVVDTLKLTQDAVGIGKSAGNAGQQPYAIAMGYQAGQTNQQINAVAIGVNAGQTTQAAHTVALGDGSGNVGQQEYAVAMGYQAGKTSQGVNAVAIGVNAGQTTQGARAFALGDGSGNVDQQPYAIAIGVQAGQTNQQPYAIAMGYQAGNTGQGQYAVAIGSEAGATGQGQYAVAVGRLAGSNGQSNNAVAVGYQAGNTGQGQFAVAIGYGAGATGQSSSAIAIGYGAGANNQGLGGIAIGTAIDQQTGGQTIAIGNAAVSVAPQNQGAIAIGFQACKQGQGNYSIHIGYRDPQPVLQPANSILLNATGDAGSGGFGSSFQSVANGFCVAPVRNAPSATGGGGVYYNNTGKEFTWDAAKSFIIDHPLDPVNKHLVHVCLEGPEAGVYYRGKGEIVNGSFVEVQLPSYVGALCTDLTVQITPIYDGIVKTSMLCASEVDTAANTFTVHGENGRFNWLVHGKRGDVTVEPNKADVTVRGDGPYKYIA